jgi:23S rRNA pseudouridine955/2504/2580 synthase
MKNVIDILNKFSEDKKFYLVHRIDKETSGIIVFACNRLFAQNLSEQFRNKDINTYLLVNRRYLNEDHNSQLKKFWIGGEIYYYNSNLKQNCTFGIARIYLKKSGFV